VLRRGVRLRAGGRTLNCNCACHTGPYAACSVLGGCGSVGCSAGSVWPGAASPQSDIPLGERCVLTHRRDEGRPRRALDSLYVCAGHRKGLAFDLLDLPGLYEALPERHNARSGIRSERGASGHAGLNLLDDPAECRQQIYFTLAGWTKDMIERRNLSTRPDDNVRSIAAFLLGHRAANLDWLCAHPAVDELFKEIDPLTSWAFRLVYPRGRRRFEVGDCIEVTSCDVETRAEQRCPGRMLATLTDADDQLPSLLWCGDCGLEITADRWITYGRRVLRMESAAQTA